MSRAVWILPCALPAILVLALARLPNFGWESLLILGGTALALPVLFMSAINNRS